MLTNDLWIWPGMNEWMKHIVQSQFELLHFLLPHRSVTPSRKGTVESGTFDSSAHSTPFESMIPGLVHTSGQSLRSVSAFCCLRTGLRTCHLTRPFTHSLQWFCSHSLIQFQCVSSHTFVAIVLSVHLHLDSSILSHNSTQPNSNSNKPKESFAMPSSVLGTHKPSRDGNQFSLFIRLLKQLQKRIIIGESAVKWCWRVREWRTIETWLLMLDFYQTGLR